MKNKKLKITAQGGWDVIFESGIWCGKANDSVNVRTLTYIGKRDIPGTMAWVDVGTLKRSDLKRIIVFFNSILSKKARRNPLTV